MNNARIHYKDIKLYLVTISAKWKILSKIFNHQALTESARKVKFYTDATISKAIVPYKECSLKLSDA